MTDEGRGLWLGWLLLAAAALLIEAADYIEAYCVR